MKREIKFKAWDKVNKEIIEIDSLSWLNKKLHFFSGGKRIYRDGMENYILMQYTGLKDKNGVEIYEGDIIKMTGWAPENNEIIFIEGAFCFINGTGLPNDMTFCEDSTGNHCEVIGNIYENPKLI